ncbi:MAG TPA: hypothetical protein VGJ28_27800 [Micromonosporaceae bacterium]|jgi:hypothetical protein
MSYYDQTGYAGLTTATAPKRPGTVMASTYLLFACAGMALAGAVASFAAITPIHNNYLASGVTDEGSDTGTGVMILYAIIAIAVAVVMTLCGFFVLRPRQGFRVTTFVLAGVTILIGLCGAFNVGGDALIGNGSITGTTDPQTQATISAIPGWYEATAATLLSLTALALIVVIILLAVRSSGRFYRSQVLMMPAYGGYAVPGYPYAAAGYGAPAHPGYPATVYPGSDTPASAYPAQGYQGYPSYPGYPAQGYPAPGYPAPGYPAQDSPTPAAEPTPSSSQWAPPVQPTAIDSGPGYDPTATANDPDRPGPLPGA